MPDGTLQLQTLVDERKELKQQYQRSDLFYGARREPANDGFWVAVGCVSAGAISAFWGTSQLDNEGRLGGATSIAFGFLIVCFGLWGPFP